NGQAVGTARIRYLDETTAKIERLAVLPMARRKGIGKQITMVALDVIALAQLLCWRSHPERGMKHKP
nr:GNAT family N-acetyltransferase [Calothrix sp. MO_167.B12]